MRMKKFKESFSGKGYYIALVLCAVAIGVSGFLYYRNAGKTEPTLQDPTNAVDATVNNGSDVQAVATDPSGNTVTPTVPTPSQGEDVPKPVKPVRPAKTAAPVAGETVMPYAMDCLCYNQTTRDWRTHNGVDIAAEAGTFVTAAADGTVYTVYEDDTMGTTVVISHDGGYTTSYASLDQEVLVEPGDPVTLGQQLGTVGQTALLESAIGDHVHFSVSCNDEPVDPADFLAGSE